MGSCLNDTWFIDQLMSQAEKYGEDPVLMLAVGLLVGEPEALANPSDDQIIREIGSSYYYYYCITIAIIITINYYIRESRRLAPVRPRMRAAGLQCLRLQIAVASPDPHTRTFPGTQVSRKTWSPKLKRELRGSQGMRVVTTGLIVFYSQLLTCSNPHVDRCSNPLPWDPLSSPQRAGSPKVEITMRNNNTTTTTTNNNNHIKYNYSTDSDSNDITI